MGTLKGLARILRISISYMYIDTTGQSQLYIFYANTEEPTKNLFNIQFTLSINLQIQKDSRMQNMAIIFIIWTNKQDSREESV